MSTFETEAIEYRSERLKYWNNINASAPRAWSNYYRKEITSTYCQLIPENSSILELGCGQGDLLNAKTAKLNVVTHEHSADNPRPRAIRPSLA